MPNTPVAAFRRTLYGDAETGWLSLLYLPTRRVHWFRLTDEVPSLDQTQNCYLGLGIRQQRSPGRGKLEDVIGIPGFWLDLDYESPGAHKATHPLPPDERACHALLAQAPMSPSLLVHSGHGIQAYWLFHEPWYFETDDERVRAAQLCRGWQGWFQHHAKTRGWHVDSTADLTRVLRIPGSQNHKTPPPRAVRVLHDDARRYHASDFEDYIAEDIFPQVTVAPNGLTPQSIDVVPIPRLPDRVKYLIIHGDTLQHYPSRSEAVFAAINALIGAGREDEEIAGILLDTRYALSEMPREKGQRWLVYEIARAHQKGASVTPAAPEPVVPIHAPILPAPAGLPAPQTATELLAKDIPPQRQMAEGLIREGLLLFGGKSKRGKSWLMLDLAIAVAAGRSALRHFPTPGAQPVLYLALEDGERRIKSRLRAIQPNLETLDNLQFLYKFPLLTQDGIKRLQTYIETYHYALVVIDVLARVEPEAKGKQEKGYREVYQMFAPLQELRNRIPFCLAMMTHLRKQEAEDIFETFHGSIGYAGAQDYLWVLERKPKDDFAFLHVQDKDAEDKTLTLRFLDGHWEYIGEGEEYQLDKERRNILKVLQEEQRELSIQEIMKSCGIPEARYPYVRKMLTALVKDDMIHRARQGRYSATVRAMEEVGDDDDMPF